MAGSRVGSDGMRSRFCGLRCRARDQAQRRDYGCACRNAAQRLHMPLKESPAPKFAVRQRSRHRIPQGDPHAPIQRELWSNTV